MNKLSEEVLKEAIQGVGFRATKPRLLVLTFLKKTKYPVSIKDVISGVGKKIDQVTVYRILEAFKKTGVVAQVDFQHGRAYYELKDSKRDHHHIICTNCDRIEDFTGCDYAHLVEKALNQTKGFAKVTNHSFELFGVCNSCASR